MSREHGPFGFGTMGGRLPSTFGRTFFVDYDHGSDGYDGSNMDKPFKTVEQGYDALRTNRHDCLILSAYSAHPLSDELLIAKNRVHIFGADPGAGAGGDGRIFGHRTRLEMGLTTGTAIAAVQITGVGVSLHNLKIRSTDSLATSLFALADGGEYTVLDHVNLEKDEDLNQITAAELLCNGDTSFYYRCGIGNNIYTKSVARGCVLLTRETIAGKVARDVTFEKCILQHKTSATTGVHVKITTATDVERMMLFDRCLFWNDKLSSAAQALVFGSGAALTDGMILLRDSWSINVTDTCATARGIYTTAGSPATTGGEAVLTATT